MGRRLETEVRMGLEHERGGKLLADEAAAEGAEVDRIDITRFDTRVLERAGGGLDDHVLDVLAFVLADFEMFPTNDAGGHFVRLLVVGSDIGPPSSGPVVMFALIRTA